MNSSGDILMCVVPSRQGLFSCSSPGDNYDPRSSHVAAAMQVKVHRAKLTSAPSIEIWGSGTPRREFLHVDDLADAVVFMMERYSDEPHLNVGTGIDIAIRELAELVAEIAGWRGQFRYDPSKPDGMPRKVLDVSRLAALGWRAKIPLAPGFRMAYKWYVENASAGLAAAGAASDP
jgi:GDP-L-fucose synthase